MKYFLKTYCMALIQFRRFSVYCEVCEAEHTHVFLLLFHLGKSFQPRAANRNQSLQSTDPCFGLNAWQTEHFCILIRLTPFSLQKLMGWSEIQSQPFRLILPHTYLSSVLKQTLTLILKWPETEYTSPIFMNLHNSNKLFISSLVIDDGDY